MRKNFETQRIQCKDLIIFNKTFRVKLRHFPYDYLRIWIKFVYPQGYGSSYVVVSGTVNLNREWASEKTSHLDHYDPNTNTLHFDNLYCFDDFDKIECPNSILKFIEKCLKETKEFESKLKV